MLLLFVPAPTDQWLWLQIWAFCSINEVAKELEEPFMDEKNDIALRLLSSHTVTVTLDHHASVTPSLLYSIKRLSSPHTVTLLAIPHRGRRRAVAAAIDAFCLAARDGGLETQVAHEERWFTILQVGLTQRAEHI